MAFTLRQNLLRNTVWNYVGFAVNLAVNVLLFPLAIASMGDAATAVWLLIGSVSGYMGLLQLGLSPAVAQFAAGHIARGDDDGLARTVSTALALVLSLGALALLALPAVPWMLDWFSIPDPIRGEATVAFVVWTDRHRAAGRTFSPAASPLFEAVYLAPTAGVFKVRRAPPR